MATGTFLKAALVILMFVLVVGVPAAAGGQILYVDDDATGNNDGSSWADAFNYLQDALAVAVGGDEIHVAQGIYKPDQGAGITPGDRKATFQLKNGVILKGGYAGFGQPDPNALDIQLYKTILTGDLEGNDETVDYVDRLHHDPNRQENSYHVVTGTGTDSTAILDGLTICGGNANASYGDPTYPGGIRGGGMFNYPGGSPTLVYCTFRGNYAVFGGGMYNKENSSPTLSHCVFSGNKAQDGAGMYNHDNCTSVLKDCIFRGNLLTSGSGGGMKNLYSSPTLINCIFTGNIAAYAGGGIFNSYSSNVSLINCIFSGNSTGYHGGVMYNKESSSPKLINCTLSGNSVGEYGYCGGVYNESDCNPILTNSILWGNRDQNGAVELAQVYGGTPVVNYCCIQGWKGNLGGTGNIGKDPMFVDANGVDSVAGTEDDNLRLLAGSPCLDAGDNSVLPPSVITDLDGNPRIINGTVDMGAYEGPKQGLILSTNSVTFPEGQTATFTVVLRMEPLGTVEVTVSRVSGDPDITVESGAFLTFDSSNYSEPQTVTLAAAEDGDNLTGIALIHVSGPGLVTHEVIATEDENEPNPNVVFVDPDSPTVHGTFYGMVWEDAFSILQDALSFVAANPEVEEIRVAQGTYRPDQGVENQPGDRMATFQLINGVAMKGGYAGYGEPDPNARDFATYETILSGDLANNDVEVTDPCDLLNEPTRAENSCHVVTGSGTDITTVLEGFTITGGNANEVTYTYRWGGGMFNSGGSPTVRSCFFTMNSAKGAGGGMCNWFNDTDKIGSSPRVTYCRFSWNWAESGGAMKNSSYGDPTLSHCIFSGNVAKHDGGAIYNSSNTTLTNCTFTANSARYTGGIHNYRGQATLTNCILWGNSDREGTVEDSQIHRCVLKYSCIQGWNEESGGIGNIGEEPMLVETLGADNIPGTKDDNLRLLAGSPCLDAGNNEAVPSDRFDLDDDEDTVEPIPYDFDGENSIVNGKVDMGAYEGPHQGLVLCPKSLPVPEAETAIFTVALAMDPHTSVEVTVSFHSGDGDISIVSGECLTFDSSNYSQPQIVTLAAAEDADRINGTALIWVSSPGFDTARIIAAEMEILFVDDDIAGNNDGTSWAHAYNHLQDALAAASDGFEIRVAQGVYEPDLGAVITPGDRTATFHLIDGVSIKGGYAGFGAPVPNHRDVRLYEAILSGDLNGDDVQVKELCDLTTEPTRGENSYHVVTSYINNATAVLDGFTVTGGTRGGMSCGYSRPTLLRCTFSGNSAGSGGGLYNWEGARPTLTDCTFSNNWANYFGGGMYNDGSEYRCYPKLWNCTFSGNLAVREGGGMANLGSSVELRGCRFIGNIADFGGGISTGGDTYLSHCMLIANSARFKGGGIYTDEYKGLTTMTQCLVAGNSAEFGGGIYDLEGPKITHCTFAGNRVREFGGGMYSNIYSSAELIHCIFWFNSDRNGMGESAQLIGALAGMALNYNCIQGWTGLLGGIGNIGVDPCFVELGYLDANDVWINGDYHLLPDSPCVDAGDPNYVAEPNGTDLDGKPRVLDGDNDGISVVDMGAYEYNPPIPAEVDIEPHTLNLESRGRWITAFIWLPEDYNIADIDPNSICLENEIKPDRFWLTEEGDIAVAKFGREEVQSILDIGEVELRITGRLNDGTVFEATGVVIVIDQGGKK